MSEQRPEWEERIHQTLDDSVADLPADVRSRLTQARHLALAQAERKEARATLPWLVPAGGVAAAVLAVALWHSYTAPPTLPKNVAALDMELLLGDGNLELMEDLDFMLWLDKQNNAG